MASIVKQPFQTHSFDSDSSSPGRLSTPQPLGLHPDTQHRRLRAPLALLALPGTYKLRCVRIGHFLTFPITKWNLNAMLCQTGWQQANPPPGGPPQDCSRVLGVRTASEHRGGTRACCHGLQDIMHAASFLPCGSRCFCAGLGHRTLWTG